ncbi:MAG: hypothetical protein LBI05_00760 [Planctomycetaceae bacterium]|jgi:hypothetical protein|nr:hypothetical protein [Planctomycetaceae bacterium]
MTKLDTDWYPEVIPGFDALEMKAKVQAEILRETKGMTETEILAFFRKGSQEFQEELRLRWAERAAKFPS